MRTSKKPRINCSGLRRFDSNETAFLAGQLESIDPVNYETLFAALLARDFIPNDDGIDPTATHRTYRVWRPIGNAKISAPGANDAPLVQLVREEKTRQIKEITDAYGWNIDEIRAAAKTGTQLDTQLATEAMTEIARKIDNMLAFGDPNTSDITGLLNDPNVDDSVTPVDKTGGGTEWDDDSKPDEWIADVNKAIAATRTRLKQAAFAAGGGRQPAFNKFVVLLPQSNYTKAANTPRTSTSDTTVLDFLLRNRFIESVEEWYQCDEAGGSSDGRMVVYPRDARALGAVVPIDFESLPPQEEGFMINIPCRGKCGGTIIRYPLAFTYMDGI